MTIDPLALLRATEAYLAATHEHVARHDNMGADLTCGGCALRTRIAATLAAQALAEPAPVDRASILRVEADRQTQLVVADDLARRRDVAAVRRQFVREVRRLADEAQQPELLPVCEGFQWIGQSFATCDRCGQPAWNHVGEEVPAEGAGPFSAERTVRLWKPGEADAIRAKWAPAAAAQR